MQQNNLYFYSESCELLTGEFAPILAVTPQTSVGKVISLMSSTQLSCALVVEAIAPASRLLGIFTERDVVRLAGKGELGSLRRRHIAKVMTQPVICLSLAEARDAWKVCQVLCQHQIRHLPVVDEERLVGLVTLESILRKLRKTSSCQEGEDSITAIASLSKRAEEETSDAPSESPQVRLTVSPLPLEKSRSLNRLTSAYSSRSIPPPTGKESERFRYMIDNRFSDIIYSEFGEIIKTRWKQIKTEEVSVKQFPSPEVSCDTPHCFASDVTEYKKQLAEALVESEEHFRQIAGSIDMVFWIASVDMNQILYISPGYERIWGRSLAQLYEQPQLWWETIHIAERKRLLVALARQRRKHCEFNEEFRILLPDGSIRWIWARSFLIRNQRGEVYRCTGVGVDITESKQMEETLLLTQKRLQQLLSSSPAVIYRAKISREWAIDFVSENVTVVLGYQPEEFTQEACFWRDRIHPQDKAWVLAQFPKLLAEERYSCEYRFVCRDGSYRWLRDERRLIRDSAGNPLEMVGYWADISAQKAAEEEMRKARAKEKELSQLRSRFITLTSHEFRTPLCTILSSADLLEYYTEQAEQFKKQLEEIIAQLPLSSALANLYSGGKKNKKILPLEKLREHIQRIQNAALHMTEMLNNIFIIGKADAGSLTCNLQPLDLREFCQQLVAEINNSSSEPLGEKICTTHPITFVCRGNCCNAVMDEKLLRHILNNLLSNAIKYSPQGSPILLELTCQDNEENHPVAIFRISDSGIGIPPEDREKIFESFYRGNNVGNKSGIGLGLAIVKKAIEIQGGQITLESEVGAGTIFTVILPLFPDYNSEIGKR
ncbi:MAG: PAS domain-containing protein [Oscillatoriaceae bacterium SKYG93]|nr:PAS domain-containing protein [Oscillatoriaceae bacterium SKYG93]MDW8453674.1 PAS domain-containing protein [Oscillatoriaceae cyanobacterium SKYGB_i_bin93]